MIETRPAAPPFARRTVPAVGELIDAIDRGQVGAAYRPIVHLATGALVGWQTIARWDHPELGALTGPALRTGIGGTTAERSLDAIVVERALAALNAVAAGDGARPGSRPTMSVRPSAATLLAGDSLGWISELLDRHAIAPHRLSIEVADPVAQADVTRLADRLNDLRDVGVSITLCGIGCSDVAGADTAFGRIRSLPFDRLQLGACCTTAIDRPREQAIVRSLIALARDLSVDVVADGIDTESQDRTLRRLGCPLGSGARFGEIGPFPQRPAVSEVTTRARRRYPVPANEMQRLSLLYDTGMLDSPAEPLFDDIAAEAARLCAAPIALVTFVDVDRVFFKAGVGVSEVRSISRERSMCSFAVCDPGPTIVEDLLADPRTSDDPRVVAESGLRSYAGAPIVATDGAILGTVCVLDREPRRLTATQVGGLTRLAATASGHAELRARLRQLDRARHDRETLTHRLDDLRRSTLG